MRRNRLDSGKRLTLLSSAMGMGLRLAALALVLLAAACGGDDDDAETDATPTPAGEASYDEGTIRMEIEMLDVGLLKGHSYVDANEGWAIEGVTVEAVTGDGAEWGVIEIPEQGDADSVLFFEVQIQELPRGEQVTVTTTASFANDAGARTQRTVEDQWPP